MLPAKGRIQVRLKLNLDSSRKTSTSAKIDWNPVLAEIPRMTCELLVRRQLDHLAALTHDFRYQRRVVAS